MDKEDNGMILEITAASLCVLIGLCIVRILLGPTTPDRVVALDAANTLVIAALIVLAALFREYVYIDVAIVYAMLSFVSTLYISRYLEERE